MVVFMTRLNLIHERKEKRYVAFIPRRVRYRDTSKESRTVPAGRILSMTRNTYRDLKEDQK